MQVSEVDTQQNTIHSSVTPMTNPEMSVQQSVDGTSNRNSSGN